MVLNVKVWKYTNNLQQWSFTHDQNMKRYALYAAKVISCIVFCDVNHVAFPAEKKIAKCEWSKALVRCSWCHKCLCFHCIYICIYALICLYIYTFMNLWLHFNHFENVEDFTVVQYWCIFILSHWETICAPLTFKYV